MIEKEVIPLPCKHIYRLPDSEQGKERHNGWHHEAECNGCGKIWYLNKRKGAINISEAP
jgi:hypothetical protein